MARKTYSEEFRRQAVELYESTPGATFRGIAADLGITRNTLEGGGVVGDELEATHQRVSPAKYLAARWRISRSVVNFVVSARRAAFSVSSRAIRCS